MNTVFPLTGNEKVQGEKSRLLFLIHHQKRKRREPEKEFYKTGISVERNSRIVRGLFYPENEAGSLNHDVLRFYQIQYQEVNTWLVLHRMAGTSPA